MINLIGEVNPPASQSLESAYTNVNTADRYQVVVHIDSQVLSGEVHTKPTGEPDCYIKEEVALPVESARRLSCSCKLVTAFTHGSEPLNIGRSIRAIPTGIRRALAIRDGQCMFPGCDCSKHFDAHQLQNHSMTRRVAVRWVSLVESREMLIQETDMDTRDRRASADLAELDKLLHVDGLRLIDAGCGSMRFSRALANRGAQVLAIDPDPIQAKLNREQPAESNIEFVETGADALPADDASIDGILFSYSLHHVPANLYRKVFTEAVRVLKPNGFLCAMEPVADGALNEVMSLFHDEKQVRADAQLALNTLGKTLFTDEQVVEYSNVVQFSGWDEFADHYVITSYNTHYSKEDVRNSKVETLFEEHGKPLNYRFECPMKITCLKNPA